MVSMVTRSVIFLKMGLDLQIQSYLSANLSWKTKLGTKLNLRHWPFTPLSNIQTTIIALISAQALRLLEPLLFTGWRVAKVLTKYIFKQSKHYVCFITSVPHLATLGTFVPG